MFTTDNKLVDLVPKHYLFYIIGGFYAALFAIIAGLLAHPTVGIANTKPDPTRWIGKLPASDDGRTFDLAHGSGLRWRRLDLVLCDRVVRQHGDPAVLGVRERVC